MDFGAREILILLGILVVVAILLDGIRRVSRARHGKLRSSTRRSSRNTAIFDDDEDFPGELPGRGSRVVEVRDERSAEEVSEKIKRECDYTRNKLTTPFKARGEQPPAEHDPGVFDVPERGIADEAQSEPDFLPPQVSTPPPPPVRQPAPFTATDDFDVRDVRDTRDDSDDADIPDRVEPDWRLPEEPVAEPRRPAPATRSASHRTAATSAASSTATANRGTSAREDILILHLMAHRGEFFEGEKLLEQLLEQGLRYGEMRIFHRHETREGAGPVHFSVANSVNPGVFDLNIMDQFSTPGVTFIMPLDGLEKPLESFETLINTAVNMARKLDGELKDETRSALTKQTIEHYRQRIIDFTRRSFTLTN